MSWIIKAGLILWIAATVFWSASGPLALDAGYVAWTVVIVLIFVNAGLAGFLPWQGRDPKDRPRRKHPWARKWLLVAIGAALLVNYGAPMTLVAIHDLGAHFA